VASLVAALALTALLTACDDDEAATREDGSERVVVAALGDSITAGSPGYDPDPARRAALGFGDDERSQFGFWATEADPRLEFRNCGVFGQRTDEILLRLEECADGAGALLVQGGINDIAQGRDVQEAAVDLERTVRRGRELGLVVLIADLLPWNNGHPAADEPIAELNRLIGEIGRREDIRVLPFHDTLEDPARPGTMAAELTSDGDHPSVAGYRRLGELVAERLGAELDRR
jgi:lysophospholipase L1-like esterase